jgi:pyridoxamine 5'-phosphate oxidase
MSNPQPIRPPLNEHDAPANPLLLFGAWLEEARTSPTVYEYSAMTLATATPEGRPSARVVLLRGYDERGFCFFTNYASRKGEELAANAWAALVFWWGSLGRQIRIEGRVAKLTPAESDAYYHSRPLGSRLSAWVSAQSQVIPNREVLEAGLRALEAEYADQAPPRPTGWGGYRVAPAVIEFWQSGRHRLHDRLRYRQQEDGWVMERLAP